MPQFTQWNVPDPFPNILYNPAAVDAAIAKTQSELGGLDIERKKFGLEKAKFDRGVTEGEGYIGGSLSGTAGAGVGPLADAAPDQSRDAAGQASYAFWLGKGLAPHQAAGMAAQEVAESGGRAHVVGDGGDAFGLYQHHPDRRALILAKAGIDMNKPDANTQREGAYWELMNVEHGARQRLFASKDADEAGRAATEFERPDSKRRAIIDAERGRDARRIFQLANPNGAAGVATASVDSRAGPRVGLTPPPATQQAGQLPVPPIPPAVVPAADPNARVEADDPNTQAVKQASAALLNMPEPDAAAAYPAVVKELQARGFAMNAPPTYPGHAALQALVGGGDTAGPAVEPSRMAMRLGGTDTAGPGAGQATVPPDVQPNRLAYGTDLPGVTIGMPGNGMAPPAAAAPVVTAATPATQAPATRPQPEAPPAAPSRAIQREPLLSNNLTASQQDAARRAIRAGTPLATVQAHVEQWKQENVAARHQDAVDAAAQQQADYARQHQYQQDQIAAATRADTQRHQSVEEARQAAADKRAAEKDAREAANDAKLQQSKSDIADAERVLRAFAPKLRKGEELSDDEADQYDIARRAYARGPLQANVPDGKGGTTTAYVGQEVSDRFPLLPGQKEYAGIKPIPGTEKQADPAPPNVITSMLDIQAGNRSIVRALDKLQAYPGGVGLIPGSLPPAMSNWVDPEGVKVKAAIGQVQGHIYHELAGTAQSAGETARLRSFVPSEKDDAQAAAIKLRAMLDNNRETLLDHYATFGPEAGYRRQPGIEREILSTIPEAAVEDLKKNPDLAKGFDKKYGRGAAKLALQDG